MRKSHSEDKTASVSAPQTPSGAKIIPLRPAARIEQGNNFRDARNSAAIENADRHRTRQNIAAAIVVAVLLSIGGWVALNLRDSARTEACIEAGYRHCENKRP